jgi:hypothetical protein
MRYLKTFETFVPKKISGRADKSKEIWFKKFVEEASDSDRAKELVANFKPYLMYMYLDDVDPYYAYGQANRDCKYGWKHQNYHTGIWEVDAFKEEKDALEYGKLLKEVLETSEDEYYLQHLSFFVEGRDKDHVHEELNIRTLVFEDGRTYTPDKDILLVN